MTSTIKKLLDKYHFTTNKAATRSKDAYMQYVTASTNFKKLPSNSPQKSSLQSRLHLIINQSSSIMCSSLQNIEDILSTLEEIRDQINTNGEDMNYNFCAVNPFHCFPTSLQKYFSNPTLSPSKMKLINRKLRKKKKPKKLLCDGDVKNRHGVVDLQPPTFLNDEKCVHERGYTEKQPDLQNLSADVSFDKRAAGSNHIEEDTPQRKTSGEVQGVHGRDINNGRKLVSDNSFSELSSPPLSPNVSQKEIVISFTTNNISQQKVRPYEYDDDKNVNVEE